MLTVTESACWKEHSQLHAG